jgi:hypothetical protein
MKKLKLIIFCILFLQDVSKAEVKVYPVPPTTIGGGGFLCSTGGSNSGNAFDLLINTWSSLNITVGALCTVYQDFTFVQSTNMVGSNFHVFFAASNGSSILGLGALSTSTVTLYDAGGSAVQSASLTSSALTINLFSSTSGFNVYELTMPVEVEFVRARVQMSGIFLFSGFRVYEIYYSYSPLPVELAYFKAENYGSSIALNWKTYSELNNHFFEIERGMKGAEYNVIAKVNGNGTTNIAQHYSLKDADVNNTSEMIYYRLTQVDFNGERHAYAPVAVNLKKQREIIISASSANNNPQVNIKNMDESGDYSISLFSIDGRLVYTEDIKQQSSFNKSFANIENGFFIVKVIEHVTEHVYAQKIAMQ